MIKKKFLLTISLVSVFQNTYSSPLRTAIRRIAIASPTIGTAFALFGEKGLFGGAEKLSDISLGGIRKRQDDICDSFVGGTMLLPMVVIGTPIAAGLVCDNFLYEKAGISPFRGRPLRVVLEKVFSSELGCNIIKKNIEDSLERYGIKVKKKDKDSK